MSNARPSPRVWVPASLAVLVGWAVLRWWVVPAIIRSAYRGESWSVFNRVLSGRELHPVERYLDAWSSLSLTLSLAAVAAGTAVYGLWSSPALRKRVVAWLFADEVGMRTPTLLWYATMIGAAGGTGEVLYRAIRQAFTHRPAGDFYAELFWMAPGSAALTFLLAGGVMAGLARAAGSRWGVGRATLVLGSLALFGIIQSEGIPLTTLAEVVLAMGFAAVLARLASDNADTIVDGVRLARPLLLLFLLTLGTYAIRISPSSVEARARVGRPLPDDGLPNILLIILDTVRASNLGLYGYERPTTPEVDEWAEDAAVFERAHATAPWTLPTHASLFTGEYNATVGTGFRRPLDDRFRTLAEVFAARGYVTAGFTANPHYTTSMSGLDQGFDRFEDHVLGPALFLRSSWFARATLLRAVPISTTRGLKDASMVAEEFLDWVSAQDERPFFAFLNLFDAHEPYEAPDVLPLFGPSPIEGWYDFTEAWRSSDSRTYSEAETELWVNRYDNAIRYVDHHLGIIRDSLDARGLLEETIVVITSDHGEMWGEHGQLGHAQSLYMPSLHVPLIISFPGRVPPARIADGVSLRDVPSTLIALSGASEVRFPGNSLAELVRGRSGSGDDIRSPLLAELDRGPLSTNPWEPVFKGDMKSLVDGELHYIRNGDGVEELYDLSVDPGELSDVSGMAETRSELLRLRSLVDSILESTPSTHDRGQNTGYPPLRRPMEVARSTRTEGPIENP